MYSSIRPKNCLLSYLILTIIYFDCDKFSPFTFLCLIFLRESLTKESCCVRGRLCGIPGHWGRDLLRHPPSEAELPEDFEESFLIGKPWFFSQHVFEPL